MEGRLLDTLVHPASGTQQVLQHLHVGLRRKLLPHRPDGIDEPGRSYPEPQFVPDHVPDLDPRAGLWRVNGVALRIPLVEQGFEGRRIALLPGCHPGGDQVGNKVQVMKAVLGTVRPVHVIIHFPAEEAVGQGIPPFRIHDCVGSGPDCRQARRVRRKLLTEFRNIEEGNIRSCVIVVQPPVVLPLDKPGFHLFRGKCPIRARETLRIRQRGQQLRIRDLTDLVPEIVRLQVDVVPFRELQRRINPRAVPVLHHLVAQRTPPLARLQVNIRILRDYRSGRLRLVCPCRQGH